MKLRGIIALALVLMAAPAFAQAIPGTSPLSVAKGGTGASTAAAARSNLGLTIGSAVEAWDADLDALAANATNGLWARTGAGTGAARIITGTANEVCVTNGDGAAGNPTLGICAGWLSTAHTWAGVQTFAAPIMTGLADVQGAMKFSTQSAPAQITSNQNNYNPSSVVCATTSTLLINSDAARDITGLAGGVTGCKMHLVNTGAFTIRLLEDNASSMAANRFKTGADIPLLANGTVTLLYDGATLRWRLANLAPAAGAGTGTMTSTTAGTGLQASPNPITTSGTISAADGVTLQTVYAEQTAFTGVSATMAGGSDTVPQNTDGAQFLQVTITPKLSTSTLIIEVSGQSASSGTANYWVALFQDSIAAALAAQMVGSPVADSGMPLSLRYSMTAGTTSAITFKLRFGNFNGGSNTISINGISSARRLGGAQRLTMTVRETKG